MRSRSTFMAGGAALAAVAIGLSLVAPAYADIAPNGNDIVGVGSDTVQNMANFLADGDPSGLSSGENSAVSKNRLFTFDATPDANDRSGYLNNSTTLVPKLLNPTIVLRAGTSPVLRPNGSGNGVAALLADSVAPYKINFVRMSRLPKVAEQNTASSAPDNFGGLHVVKISSDDLEIAAATTTNAPAALTAAQVLGIYTCAAGFTKWNGAGLGNGTGSADTIVPLLPQTGSGTYGTFNGDMITANGGVQPTYCAPQVEENDPTSITGNATPADAIAPFSEGRKNLFDNNINPSGPAGGYFHDPTVPFPGSPSSLTSGIQLLTGAGSYVDVRNLYIVYRHNDDAVANGGTNTTKWQPGSGQNFAQALFYNGTGGIAPYVASGDGQSAISAGGGTPAYKDCGSGAGVTTC